MLNFLYAEDFSEREWIKVTGAIYTGVDFVIDVTYGKAVSLCGVMHPETDGPRKSLDVYTLALVRPRHFATPYCATATARVER